MKFFRTFYGKLSAVFLILLLLLGLAQVLITFRSSMKFVNEADQQLNLGLAKSMAAELEPLLQDSLSVPRIQQSIHYMMVMNPKVEIYVLDDQGKILAFFADPPKKVRQTHVNLNPIRTFLNSSRERLILGEDPRNSGRQKPFSAAVLPIGQEMQGYLYIILGGEQYDTALNMVRNSYIVKTSFRTLLVTFVFAALIGLILFAFLTRRLRSVTAVVNEFEQGNLDQRIEVKSQDEIGQLGRTFNQMADTIEANMEELKRIDELRRELVANVSHDLRSPLASIQGYLETILIKESRLDPDERKKYMETILHNTEMLNNLVEELFELSKLDARQTEPAREPFSIAELTQDVVMKLENSAEKAEVNLEADLSERVPMVYADIGLIERALSNLLENAIRYTGQDGEVSIRLVPENHLVKIQVADTGPGISEEDLPHIFDRFYRADKSRSRQPGGTGLGLAIAKKIMDIHGQTLNVESEVGKGTTFWFSIDVWNGSE